MSRQINQPSNQIKLTNVSLVRLKKGKKRFEIACYKNKVVEWRQGIETDPDEVLQIPSTVFLNVSKGQTAPRDDLDRAFGRGRPVADIVLDILNTGEIQVGERERNAQLERVRNEVVATVAAKLVDPRTKHVYTPGMIEKALDLLTAQAHAKPDEDGSKKDHGKKSQQHDDGDGGEAHAAAGTEDAARNGMEDDAGKRPAAPVWTGVVTTRSAKSQALDAMKALIAHQPIPVARARMRVRVACAVGVLKQAVKAAVDGPGAGGAAGAAAGEHAAAAGGGGGGGKGKKGKGKGGKHKGADADDADAAVPQQQPTEAVAAGAGGDDDNSTAKAPGTVKDKILSYFEQVENQDMVGSEWEVVGFVEPGAFKALSDFVSNDTRGQGRVEVLDLALTHDD